MSDYRPLSARNDPRRNAQYDALHDGVPPWLETSLLDWLGPFFHAWTDYPPGWTPSEESVLRAERILRVQLGSYAEMMSRAGADHEIALDLVDFALHEMDEWDTAPDRLEELLTQAGSAWRVVRSGSGWALERRVRRELEVLADDARSPGARAGEHLTRSWNLAYGRKPDPSGAYREAIRAVEAALQPIVSPRDATATLGKMIGEVDGNRTKWKMRLEPTRGDALETFIAMLRTLWTAQRDRHGTSDESIPLSVAQEQAEDAVSLSALIVHWLQSGAFTQQ